VELSDTSTHSFTTTLYLWRGRKKIPSAVSMVKGLLKPLLGPHKAQPIHSIYTSQKYLPGRGSSQEKCLFQRTILGSCVVTATWRWEKGETNTPSAVYFNLTLLFSMSRVTHIFIEMARFCTQDNQCEICDEKRGTGAWFSPSASVSRCQHSINSRILSGAGIMAQIMVHVTSNTASSQQKIKNKGIY
jgi:hypothetical protein